jgi:hypothetical protein
MIAGIMFGVGGATVRVPKVAFFLPGDQCAWSDHSHFG